MDVIGYDAAVPEPPTLTLVGLAVGMLLFARRIVPAVTKITELPVE